MKCEICARNATSHLSSHLCQEHLRQVRDYIDSLKDGRVVELRGGESFNVRLLDNWGALSGTLSVTPRINQAGECESVYVNRTKFVPFVEPPATVEKVDDNYEVTSPSGLNYQYVKRWAADALYDHMKQERGENA